MSWSPGSAASAPSRRLPTGLCNGSFVSAKPEPGDFDVCWDITDVDADLVPAVFFEFGAGRAAQKAQFGGEFFPAQLPEGLSGQTFLEFFQRDRDGRPKGIVALELEIP